jgi:hypothetical protein
MLILLAILGVDWSSALNKKQSWELSKIVLCPLNFTEIIAATQQARKA